MPPSAAGLRCDICLKHCYSGQVSVRILEMTAAATRREQQLTMRSTATSNMSDLPDKLGALESATAAFTAMGASYALIGGLAVGIRSGVPRATLDVDFAVPTNIDKNAVIAAFNAQSFRLTGGFEHSVNFRHASGEPVQVAFDQSFDAMIGRAEVMHFGKLQLRVVTTADLIEMKRRAAADPKRRRSKALRDQADIALLEGDVSDPDEGW